METLKPCKNCGAVPEMETHPTFGKQRCIYVVRIVCKCNGILVESNSIAKSVDEAAQLWNERQVREQ
jgi:hypothetical protein